MTPPSADGATTPKRYSAPKERTLAVALELFAERGVTGTSLQMIADELGVTKAAIYHQFRTKEAIVLAVAERELEKLEGWVDEAEAAGATPEARELLLTRLVDLALERRGAVSALQIDPGMVQLLGQHEPFQLVMIRMFTVLLGGDIGASAQVEAAILSGVIGATVGHPLVVGLDDAVLRDELLRFCRRLLQLPESRLPTRRRRRSAR